MILNVEFVYHATIRQQRKRLHDERHYVAVQPVEVREVDPALAPVALRASTDKLREGVKVRDYRLFEDGLWLPVMDRDGDPVAGGWLAAEATAVRTDPYGYGNAFDATVQNRMRVAGRYEDDAGVAALIGSDRDERAAAVRAAAAGYLLIGGVPHQRAPEPIYQVSESNSGTAFVYVESYAAPVGDAASNFGIHLYRADERGLMLGSYDVYRPDRKNVIEVIIPEAVRAPIPERALSTAARVMRDSLGKMALSRDVAFFATYAAVRDGLAALDRDIAAAERGGPAPACDAIVPALQEAVRTLRRIDPDARRSLAEEWTEKALSRIEERQLSQVPTIGP